MTTPLKYFTNLMDRVFGDQETRTFDGGIENETNMTFPVWEEIHNAMPKMYTSAKMAIISALSDIAYIELRNFLAQHKYDVERDYLGEIVVKMSIRKR